MQGVKKSPKTGENYGLWTVIANGGRDSTGNVLAKVRCVCGTVRNLRLTVLIKDKSSGCYNCRCVPPTRTTHGMSYTPEYIAWLHIKSRCFNTKDPEYKNYGGRGIILYKEWIVSFQDFLNHIGLRPTINHSIDRIDNELGYIPGNIEWVTSYVQTRNTRRNVYVTIRGETKVLADWARDYNIPLSTVYGRINRGATIIEALMTGVCEIDAVPS